jgi:hypothetical protein
MLVEFTSVFVVFGIVRILSEAMNQRLEKLIGSRPGQKP